MLPRAAATAVVERLARAGFEAYLAGGCVRDHLLGIEPDDYDVATSASPEDVKRVFPGSRGVGEAFGVVLVRVGGHTIEVATFRSDGTYADGRRPDSVRFSSAAEDAERRDFTINGLFQDPVSGKVVDFVGGERDLRERVLRAIGDPERRFAEDHLRLLRAVRFAARFGFLIEPETARAIRTCAPRLAAIARERIGGEVRRMLSEPARPRAVRLLEEFGLDAVVLDEPHRVSVGRRVETPPSEVPFAWALAAWALDRSGDGPETECDPDLPDRWRAALLLSNDETNDVREGLACRRALRAFADLPLSGRKRLAARPGFPMATWLLRREAPERADAVDHWHAATPEAERWPTPLLSGQDLIAAGLAPGPAFKRVLDAVFNEQLDGRLTTRADAIARAIEIAAKDKGSGAGVPRSG
ncbi:MAG: CCA tRNA nucleotidyltransferase [Phycisphaerae bacterium]|nr:CCA tRNA nucleotidyltransferase [Phycisphaerae bacterium]